MFTLKIKNYKGELFELSHDYRNYAVIGVQGLTYPSAAVNTASGGAVDGSFYNSTRVEQRNIVINVIIQGDIEMNRARLYRVFPIKKPCTVYFENKNRSVMIEGYVEIVESDLFTERQQVQISLICPRPYFEAAEAIITELSQIVREFQFPFDISEDDPVPMSEIVEVPLAVIDNSGDVECGVIISAVFTGAASGLTIYNTTTGQQFGLDYVFQSSDELEISTVQGGLHVTLTRGGVAYNLINYLTAASAWFRLDLGENNLTYSATGAENVSFEIKTRLLYGGV